MLVAVTATLTPLALWLVFGLYERLAPPPRPPRLFSPRLFSPEERKRLAEFREELLKAARAGQWQRVVKRTDDTCGGDCPPQLLPLQAEAHWRLGNRDQSASLWSRTLPWESPVAQADFQTLKGDKKTYVSFVAPLLVSQERVVLNDAAWACVIMAGALPDYKPVVTLAEKALQQATTPEDKGNVLNTLGVALYRAGRYADAVKRLEESERLTKTKMNTIFLALSYNKLGQREKAQPLAESVYTYMRTSLAESNRFRPEFLIFEKELEAVFPSKKPKSASPLPPTKATAQ